MLKLTIYRISVGGTISLTLSKTDGSMSVLIPSQRPLLHRACLDREEWYLLEWFSVNEIRAWEAVNTAYRTNRPEKIFLVTGQTLTSEYAISHQEHSSNGCEILVEGGAEISSLVDARLFMGYDYQRVYASCGFEIMARNSSANDDEPRYSVYIEKYESFPIKRFSGKSLASRFLEMYR
jgi:hypothetical protein